MFPLHIHSFEDRLHSGRPRLFHLCYTLDWGGVYFFTFWLVFFLLMPHTHSSSLGTLFWESDVTFSIHFLILFFLSVQQAFFFSYYLQFQDDIPCHLQRQKTQCDCRGNRVLIFLHCLLKKQILKRKKKEKKKPQVGRSMWLRFIPHWPQRLMLTAVEWVGIWSWY